MSYYLAQVIFNYRKSEGSSKIMVKKRKKSSTTSKTKTTRSTTTKTTAKAKKTKKTKTKSASPSASKNFKVSKALTRSQQIAFIAEQTSLSKKDVAAVIECFEPMIASHLRGPGQISLAGLMKVVAVRKPATKARKGINPFTGEPTVFKAKPARNIVRIRALKKVKDLVA